MRSFREMLGKRWKCEHCSQEHFIPTEWILDGEGALERLPDKLKEMGWERVLIVADGTTWEVAGGRVFDLLKGAVDRVDRIVLPSPPEASEELGREVLGAIGSDTSGLVAVGSGTVNDLTKWAAQRGGLPYLVVPTAASMNGYTSSIAALIVKGVKRTIPSAPPIGVCAEPEVVSSAPQRMTASGYADLQSKSVADIDWHISHLLFGLYYCPLPRMGVSSAEGKLRGAEGRLRRNEPGAVMALLEALLESGMGMTVAGSSSPASGGEHLISHWLDMNAERAGRKPAMHGEQVGLGTIISAKIYELLLQSDPSSWRPDPSDLTPPERRREEFRRRYGPDAEEVMEQFKAKWVDEGGRKELLERMAEMWDEMRRVISESLIPAAQLKEKLGSVGAPTRISQIGVDEEEFREAILHAREIRNRWTSLDLAYLVGILPDRVDELLGEVI